MPANCSPDKIIAALFEQAEVITNIVDEKIKDAPRLALRMIPDGGTVRRNQNSDSVIYGEAKQAAVAYRNLDHSPKPIHATVDGGGELGVTQDFPARTLQGSGGIFSADANDIDDNACHGQVTIDFSQGYRIRRTTDYGLDLTTPIKCARELDRLGAAHIRGYFNGMKNQFTSFGLDNFDDNLLNLMIQFSEANASVLAANQFNVTTGGWSAPPLYRITIHFLQDYRDYVMAEMKGFGLDVPEDFKLEVEMPREDWIEAVRKDQLERNGTGTSYNTEWFKDDEGPLRGREMGIYGGIKCYFNEEPIRGYFLPTSTTTHRFVRVYSWINTPDEEAGIVRRANHQYRADTIVVEGVEYPMVTLIPHIDRRSFKRYSLLKPLKPIGSDNAGVNYQVKVIDGARLGCNDFDDKFKLVARHEFRFKAERPEISGFIAYRHGRRQGYVLPVTPRDYAAGGTTANATQEVFRQHETDSCQEAECAQCGKVSEVDGTCVDPGSVTAAVVGLLPAGAVTYAFLGAGNLKVLVERTGGSAGAVSVAYATADGTATAGSDYTAASGTLEWAAGDNDPKEITVPILAAATEDQTFTITLTSPVGATLKTGANVTTVTVKDLV